MATPNGPTSTGAALVLGGGVAGIQCSLDLAEGGYKVYLVEKSPALGGHMSQLDKTFPTNDCSMCTLAPKLVEAGRHLNIEIVTNSELTGLEGEPGDFKAKVYHHARFVDPDLCTSCGECAPVCPVVVADQYNEELGERKAIYKLYPQAIPNTYAVTKKGHSPCKRACAVHTSAQGYVALIAQGRFADAYRVASEPNPFPAVCGRVCTHKCETDCTRGEIEQPIAIAGLKRFVSDFAVRQRAAARAGRGRPSTRRSPIVGAGPSGLTVRPRPGPARLPDDRLRGQARARRHAALRHPRVPPAQGRPAAGHRPHPRARRRAAVRQGGRHRLHRRLACSNDGYKAVYLGVGLQGGRPLPIPGNDAKGVFTAVDLLRDATLGKPVDMGKNVVVIGGGDVAFDAGRTALRLGAEKVTARLHRRRRRPCRPRPTRSKRASTSRSASSARACRRPSWPAPTAAPPRSSSPPARWARPTSAAGARRCPSTTPSASSPATPSIFATGQGMVDDFADGRQGRQGREEPDRDRQADPGHRPQGRVRRRRRRGRAAPGRPSRPSPPAAAAPAAIHNFLRGEELLAAGRRVHGRGQARRRRAAPRPRSWRVSPCRTWPAPPASSPGTRSTPASPPSRPSPRPSAASTAPSARSAWSACGPAARAPCCTASTTASSTSRSAPSCWPPASTSTTPATRASTATAATRTSSRRSSTSACSAPRGPTIGEVKRPLQRRAPQEDRLHPVRRLARPGPRVLLERLLHVRQQAGDADHRPRARRASPTSSSWTCAPRARASTPSTSAPRTWASTSSARGPRTSRKTR